MSLDSAALLHASPVGVRVRLETAPASQGSEHLHRVSRASKTHIALGRCLFLFKRQKNDRWFMPHVSEVGNKEGTVGLGGGQTAPDFGGFAHGARCSEEPAAQSPSPRAATVCLAGHCSGRHFWAPVLVDCQDCLGSESASGQTALRCSRGCSEDGPSQV